MVSLIYPFEIDAHSKDFANKHYPDLSTLKNIKLVSYKERLDIARIYFTEGIPFAFLKNPILYEKIRAWLSKHLLVNPKSLSLTGSARIGYTINPHKIQGTMFSSKSDLDFIIVDETCYYSVVKDFFSFVEQLNANMSRTLIVNEHLLNNIIEIEKNINNYRFIDQWKIPNWNGLPKINLMYSYLKHLKERMKITENCPQVQKVSIRIYEDWESCVNRMSFNIYDALK